MRRLIIPILVLLNNWCFAQTDSVLRIDSNISIRLPGHYELIDTIFNVSDITEMKVIAASIDSGRIIFTKGRQTEEMIRIKDEKALLEFYDGVKEGFANTVQGKILTDSIIEINNLKIQKLSLNLNYEGEPCILHYLGFFLDYYKYSLQVFELTSKKIKLGINISDLISCSGDLSIKRQLIQ